MHRDDILPIGVLATRTGLAVSAIRFYEEQGLLTATRNAGGQRRFRRSDIRRLSFVIAAQRAGLTLEAIRDILRSLPQERTPTAADWRRIGSALRRHLDARIAELALFRDKLDECIGCGCLSLSKCALYNRDDVAARRGAGPRYLLGDRHDDIG